LKSYQPLDQISQLVAKAESAQQQIESVETRIVKLRELVTQLSSLKSQQRFLSAQDQSFKKLIAPTAQHDVGRMQTRISDLAKLLQDQQQARKVLGCCETLRSTPPYHDTKTLRALLNRFATSIDGKVQSKLAERTFSLLTRPPQVSSVDGIRQTIAKLTEQHANVASSKIIKGALNDLHAPSDPSDLAPLESKIRQLRTLALGVAKARKTSVVAQQKADQSEATIRAFVRSNPTCTICGGNIDPETLLSSMPGLHQHTAGGSTGDE